MECDLPDDFFEDMTSYAERHTPRQPCSDGNHQMECVFNHESVGEHRCALACMKCQLCCHEIRWTYCGHCSDMGAIESEGAIDY
jgi:hypothetical protein